MTADEGRRDLLRQQRRRSWHNGCLRARRRLQERPVRQLVTALIAVIPTIAASWVTPASVAAQPRTGYPPPYRYRYAGAQSDLRILVTPREASVFVDGYFAGQVDDYDGVFQRLRIEPGAHEIVIYLKGHRSMRERLYLSPNATRKISGTLEPLPPGEPDEPPPTPAIPPAAPGAPFPEPRMPAASL
jgi:hypothetical protein